ncbi:hypothetical protein HID58_093039 [Brassica napus]|uniref:Uncharacterized protein n=1 Tax=Brassica napus TaxID=3708 RepID=A0ABQ7XEQ6_BRANA|nr:hypothetical protein HID58_093039 [Brassica napus]
MDPSTKLGMLPQPPPPSDKNTWNLNFVAPPPPPTGSKNVVLVQNSRLGANMVVDLMDPKIGPNTPSDHQGNTKATQRHFPLASQPKGRVDIQTGDSTPWIHHHQEKKTMRKEPVYSSNDQGRFQLLGASDSMKLPLKFHVMGKEKKQNRKAESCGEASAWPPRNSCGTIVCSVSRNPADFTIPEPGNVYMLTGESLKVRKRATYKKKTSLSKQDALKQTTENA